MSLGLRRSEQETAREFYYNANTTKILIPKQLTVERRRYLLPVSLNKRTRVQRVHKVGQSLPGPCRLRFPAAGSQLLSQEASRHRGTKEDGRLDLVFDTNDPHSTSAISQDPPRAPSRVPRVPSFPGENRTSRITWHHLAAQSTGGWI